MREEKERKRCQNQKGEREGRERKKGSTLLEAFPARVPIFITFGAWHLVPRWLQAWPPFAFAATIEPAAVPPPRKVARLSGG